MTKLYRFTGLRRQRRTNTRSLTAHTTVSNWDLKRPTLIAEITPPDSATCVYCNVSDVSLYVIGDFLENEESISQILKRCVKEKTVWDNSDLIFLAVDELCNGGQVRCLHFTCDRLQNSNVVRLYRPGGSSWYKN
ncbi:hypothetical protein P879_11322 [Paragonimus westermani]|uniref:Uncharacterized protein n=1 Tax=Paragonimus westermani TaxID=34504 RepID=A0A8T0DE81_9TREM|nr:hypothetical protein P879_11322 [Paragonimus westermani]